MVWYIVKHRNNFTFTFYHSNFIPWYRFIISAKCNAPLVAELPFLSGLWSWLGPYPLVFVWRNITVLNIQPMSSYVCNYKDNWNKNNCFSTKYLYCITVNITHINSQWSYIISQHKSPNNLLMPRCHHVTIFWLGHTSSALNTAALHQYESESQVFWVVTPCGWRQYEPLKHWYPITTLYDITAQKTLIWIFTSVKVSNLTVRKWFPVAAASKNTERWQ
jgi:hypothetical protein